MISVQYCFNHRREEKKKEKKKNFGDRAQIIRKPVFKQKSRITSVEALLYFLTKICLKRSQMNELRCWPFSGLYFTANKKVKREYQDLLSKAFWKWGMAPCRCTYIYTLSLILAQHTFQGTRAEIVDSVFTCTHPFACCFPTDLKITLPSKREFCSFIF